MKKELKRTVDAYVAIWNVVTPIGCGHSSSMTHGTQTFSADVFILQSLLDPNKIYFSAHLN